MSRRAELAANLAAVRDRLTAACAAAGRAVDEVTVVAIAKTFPASDIRLAAELGVTDVGENRDQEARRKHDELAELALRWHFVGRLQTNKAGSVARYADVVQSVDRSELVEPLARAARRHQRRVVALVQVGLPAAPGRGGAAPADLPRLADAVAAADGLTLGGVMTVAPLGANPAAVFETLAGLALRLRVDHPEAGIISAGMSGDFEAAVAAGATHLRLGAAVFGGRAPAVG